MKVIALVCLFAALAASATAQAPAPSGITDVDILNFALNLEYLEAEFYSCAANGVPLPDDLRGENGGTTEGCEKAKISGVAQALAEELASDEIAHVRLLRTALGDAAVPIPALNLGSAFASAAAAAFNVDSLSPAFSPYLNNLFFYHGAFIFEDVGVTAYEGGAGLIQNKAYLQTAAKILAVEAYHAGAIRTILYQQRETETPYNVTVADIVDAISALRARVGGGDDQGVVTDGSSGEEANITPTDSDALAFARTPAEVIDIVTLGAGPSGGGFFPNGLNGFFGASSSSS